MSGWSRIGLCCTVAPAWQHCECVTCRCTLLKVQKPHCSGHKYQEALHGYGQRMAWPPSSWRGNDKKQEQVREWQRMTRPAMTETWCTMSGTLQGLLHMLLWANRWFCPSPFYTLRVQQTKCEVSRYCCTLLWANRTFFRSLFYMFFHWCSTRSCWLRWRRLYIVVSQVLNSVFSLPTHSLPTF